MFWRAVWQSYAYVIENPATVCTVNNGVAVLNLPPPSANYVCDGDKMESGSMWLGIAGLMIIGILMSRSFKGSIIIGAPPPAPRHPEAMALAAISCDASQCRASLAWPTFGRLLREVLVTRMAQKLPRTERGFPYVTCHVLDVVYMSAQ